MNMKNELFSKEALERLRSPDQMDALMTVTKPIAWMSLLAVGLVVASAVLWSIFGSISVTVDGIGVIIDPGGVANIVHSNSGKLGKILVYPGERVKKGDIIAHIEQPILESEIMASRQKLGLSTNFHEVMTNLSEFDPLLIRYDIERLVISPTDGIVADVPINPGDMVMAGQTVICSIRQDRGREDVAAVLYVPAYEGKRVKTGMIARIAPSGVDTSQTGTLMGIVRSVSLYPATRAGLVRVIGNDDLSGWILEKVGGAVMEVRLELIRDHESPSGYLWSSVVGSPPPITPGGVCTADIVVESQAPLAKAFFKLSQWLRTE